MQNFVNLRRLIFIFFIFLSCDYQKDIHAGPRAIEGDIVSDSEYIWLDTQDLSKLKINESTEADVYRVFGNKVTKRRSYSPPIPFPRPNGSFEPIDRIFYYHSAKGKTIEMGSEFQKIRTRINTEFLSVAFFMRHNVLLFYTIRHEIPHNSSGIEFSPITSKELIEPGMKLSDALLPYAECTNDYYKKTMLRLPDSEMPLLWEECYWAQPDFGQRLLESGYFKKISNEEKRKMLELFPYWKLEKEASVRQRAAILYKSCLPLRSPPAAGFG